MSTLPPPLPAAPAVQRRPGASFVTVLAWICVAAGGLFVVFGLIEVVAAVFLPQGYQLRMLNPGGSDLPPLPPLLEWYYGNTLLLALVSLLMSSVFLLVSWGLLQRREWARRGFIAVLVLGTLLQLAWVWAVPQVVEGTLAIQMAALPADAMSDELREINQAMVTIATAVTAVMVLVFLVLHAWIVWKLCTPAVRAEFETAA